MNILAWLQRKQANLDAWADARRILVVRLDGLGDLILMTPAFRAIKASHPQVHLTLLTSPAGSQIAGLNPDLDAVLTYTSPLTDPWLEVPHDPARELRLVETLRQGEFDGAIIFTSYHQSPLPAALLCYLAGIPLRLGATDDGAGSLLTTRHHWPEGLYHEVERAMNLVGVAGFYHAAPELVLTVPPDARRRVRRWLAGAGLQPARPLVIIHPGCSMPARTYPWQSFAAAADLLVERLGAQIVLTGSAGEAPLVERIRARMRHPAAGWTGGSLAELAGLIEVADLLVTNNTGPAHVAAAVKTPVVVLFAWTNPPEQWRPWRVEHRLLNQPVACRLCYQRICPHGQECLNVPPERIADAAAGLLAGRFAERERAEAAV